MNTATRTPTLRLVTSDGETIADSSTLEGLWTQEQYLRLTDHSNRLIEFTEGFIEVLPMPTYKHQVISRFLFLALFTYLQSLGGTVLYAPLRLQIRKGKFREPDLMAARDAQDPRLQNAYWLGADLVMEIVSEDDPERDTVIKRSDYAEAGIPEYWIVNPIDETIAVLRLEGARYAEHGVFGRGDRAFSALLDGFGVDVVEVFEAN